MADEKPQGRQVVDMREVGATGLRRFSGFIYEEFLQELTGWKGIAVYKEMGDNDATVGAVLYAIRMLCRRVAWNVTPASQQPADLEAADFLETCMNDMSQTWADYIVEVLSFLLYGHSLSEIVYKRRCGDVFDPSMRSKYADGRIGWRKLSNRSQDTLYRWQFDDHGGIQGVEQLAPPHYYHVTIPVEKFLLYRTTTEKNNPEGRSIFRNAYRSWYMKKNIENIEGIGIERDLAGLPVALVPPELLSSGASAEQKALLGEIKNIVTNIRRDEQEGVIFPKLIDPASGKELYELKLMSTGGNRQFDTDKVITRYDTRIAMSALADFILMGHEKVGSFALMSSKTNLFSTAIGAFLDVIADVQNRFGVPRLFALNDFKITEYPKIGHGDVESVNLDELGQYVLRLSQAGMPLFPSADGKVENFLLKAGNMPEQPKEAAYVGLRAQQPSRSKEVTEIPANPKQTPANVDATKDTTPVNGQPPTEIVTNDSGPSPEKAQWNKMRQNRAQALVDQVRGGSAP